MKRTFMAVVTLTAALPLALLAEDATLHRQKSFPAKAGGTVKVEAAFHDVVLTVRPGETVDVTVDIKASGWGSSQQEFVKSCEPEFSQAGDTILIRSKPKSHFSFGWQNLTAKIDVRVPPGVALDVSSGSGDCSLTGETGAAARFHTGSGDITVDGACRTLETSSGSGDVKATLAQETEKVEMSAGSGDLLVSGGVRELAMETGSGSATARLTRQADKVRLHSGSGDLTLKGGAGRLSAHSGSGTIAAEGLTGGAEIESSSGDVTARWADVPGGSKISVQTSSGEIRLAFPAGAQFTGLLDTSSGDIRCDFPGTLKGRGQRSFALAGGDGSTDLQAESGSGDIQIISAK